jgi:hypothetical protein
MLSILIISCTTNEVVTVKKSNKKFWLNNSHSVEYDDFWTAIQSLDTSYVKKNKVSDDQLKYSEAISQMLRGDIQNSMINFEKLIANTTDSLIRNNSYLILSDYLFYEFKWNDMIDLDKIYFSNQLQSECDSESIKYQNLYNKLSGLPATSFNFSYETDTIPFFDLSNGTPVIQIKINGVLENFLFDTGCGITCIFSDIVENCKLTPVLDEKFVCNTGTNIIVYSQYTIINNFQIGKLEVNNSLAMIQDFQYFSEIHKDLPVKINGIVGWETIKNLDVEIDYFHKILIINKPVKKTIVNTNLLFASIPIVIAHSKDGIPLFFGYDTGAGFSDLKDGIKNKMNFKKILQAKAMVGSAGGFEEVDLEIVPEFKLLLGNNAITFSDILMQDRNISYFFLDGHLGGDFVKNGSIHFDYTNRIFEFKCFKYNDVFSFI